MRAQPFDASLPGEKTSTVSVLAVDEDDEDPALLRHHLHAMVGMQAVLTPFQDPDEALRALATQRYDVVFLDYQLGAQRTGLQVFAQIQALGLDTPVILMTDQGDEELAVNCLHAGVCDYLPKSALSHKSLQRSISNALEKVALRRELGAHQLELERTVAQLRARNEEIQSFYHTLSHELKTPLTAIDGFASILLDELQGPVADEQRSSLCRIRAGCKQMTVLLNDILDTTRIETGKMSFAPLPSSLRDVLQQALSQCGARARQARVEVETLLDLEADQAAFDPQRILQVLTNLLDNAIKYSPCGGKVRIGVAPDALDARMTRISITDEGRGIPADRIERIFERLYQASPDDATIRGGLGLGLYLARELVRMHGGTIRVESVLGKGSTFSFTLRRSPVTSLET